MQALLGESFDGLTGVRDSDATPEPVGPLPPDEAVERLLPYCSDRFLVRLKVDLIPDQRWKRASRDAEATPIELVLAPLDPGPEHC